jgi:hypothetical protein
MAFLCYFLVRDERLLEGENGAFAALLARGVISMVRNWVVKPGRRRMPKIV